MRKARRKMKPVSLFLGIFMLVISLPYPSAIAAMITTEDLMTSAQAAEARDLISKLLAREEIQQALISRGIDPMEAQARVGSLSDAEAVRFAGMVEQLPAGGSTVASVVGLAVLVFLILLVTDLLGYTNIFPFIKN